MSETLDDTWHSRDFPVLREAARLREISDPGQGASSMSICTATGLNDTQVFRALQALEAEGLVEVGWVLPATRARVVRISGEARRAVGQWPTSEIALTRIVQALEVIAGNADHPAREDAVAAADAFRHASSALHAVGDAALTGEMP